MTAGVYTLGAGLVFWGNYGNYADERFLASVVAGAGTVAILRGSRRRGWGQRHVFALAAGALVTYVWASFPVRPPYDLRAAAR
ncbi:hypothetical protein [Streptomyces sp. KL118A]|uniref:hypothetical protein n=1 Tax=Streptomyces sp. KL118A TaxID=3045153 RepID=UPI00278C5F21|nr:hypothetical protein [Streptomyces sp. KL118A]